MCGMSFGCSSYSPLQFRGCLTNASFRSTTTASGPSLGHGQDPPLGLPGIVEVGDVLEHCIGRAALDVCVMIWWAVFWILGWILVFGTSLCASSGVCGCMSSCVCRGTFRPRRRWTSEQEMCRRWTSEQEMCFAFHRHSVQLAELTDRGTVILGYSLD